MSAQTVDCTICLSSINKPTHLPCAHQFCYSCITNWSKTKLLCPLCKTPFKTLDYYLQDQIISEALPEPVVALVDTSVPDFECLTDTYFLREVNRLITHAERGHVQFLKAKPKKDDYCERRLQKVLERMRDMKVMLSSDRKFNPFELLTELYQIEAILQLLWSGNVQELNSQFPDKVTDTAIRYGADDYLQCEEDDEQDHSKNKSSRKKKKIIILIIKEENFPSILNTIINITELTNNILNHHNLLSCSKKNFSPLLRIIGKNR